MGWTKAAELVKARRERQRFESAIWLHNGQSMQTEEFKRGVERHLTGQESESWGGGHDYDSMGSPTETCRRKCLSAMGGIAGSAGGRKISSVHHMSIEVDLETMPKRI